MWFIELVLGAFSGTSSFAKKAFSILIIGIILFSLFSLFRSCSQEEQMPTKEDVNQMLDQIHNPI
jgi:hypothetical protein